MLERPIACIDIETTGLTLGVHEIIEIGGVIAQQKDETTFEVVDEFSCKIAPENIAEADASALAVNGYSPDAWTDALTRADALAYIQPYLTDAIMLGHNVAFDRAFLDYAFIAEGMTNPLHYASLDTYSLAFAKLPQRGDIYKYTLKSLAYDFGIDHTAAHTALGDARTTYALFVALLRL